MVKREGSLLIEFLFAMSILCLLLNVISIMFKGLNQVKFSNNTDFAYGLYSLTKDINLASRVEVDNQTLTLYNQNEMSEFVLHDTYLVKKPGFNIYLHRIDDLQFSHDENYVYLMLERGGENETFIIGIYKRPNKRVCEPNWSDYVPGDDYDDLCNDEFIE